MRIVDLSIPIDGSTPYDQATRSRACAWRARSPATDSTRRCACPARAGLSLNELADRAGLTKGFRSAVERDLTPWVVIMTLGFLMRRGWYDVDALQVFNRRQRGGAYWFTRGVNARGMAAWLPAAMIGLLFVNIPGQFEGPLRNVAEDAGISRLAG